MQLLLAIVAFLITVGVLITFHEFGHYCVARWCGIKILRFSIGYGTVLWSRRFGPDRTELALCALPLGGYVSMLDETSAEERESARAFQNRPLWQRVSVLLAGPVFNIVFAILAWWVVFMLGETGLRPLIATVEPGSPAVESGLRAGDEIIAVQSVPTPTRSAVGEVLIRQLIRKESASLLVRDRHGDERELALPVVHLSMDELAGKSIVQLLGIGMQRPHIPVVLGTLQKAGPAWEAGLRSGDEVLSVNGESVADWYQWQQIVRDSPGLELLLEISRNDQRMELRVVPERVLDETADGIGRLGVGAQIPEDFARGLKVRRHWPMHQAFWRAVVNTWDKSLLTLRVLGGMLMGEVALRHLSGPIAIADYAGKTFSLGLVDFLGFLAIVSVNLGVLNLLPLPPLDGGQLLFCCYEGIRGKPLGEDKRVLFLQVGLFLLFVLIVFVVMNDIRRLSGI